MGFAVRILDMISGEVGKLVPTRFQLFLSEWPIRFHAARLAYFAFHSPWWFGYSGSVKIDLPDELAPVIIEALEYLAATGQGLQRSVRNQLQGWSCAAR